MSVVFLFSFLAPRFFVCASQPSSCFSMTLFLTTANLYRPTYCPRAHVRHRQSLKSQTHSPPFTFPPPLSALPFPPPNVDLPHLPPAPGAPSPAHARPPPAVPPRPRPAPRRRPAPALRRPRPKARRPRRGALNLRPSDRPRARRDRAPRPLPTQRGPPRHLRHTRRARPHPVQFRLTHRRLHRPRSPGRPRPPLDQRREGYDRNLRPVRAALQARPHMILDRALFWGVVWLCTATGQSLIGAGRMGAPFSFRRVDSLTLDRRRRRYASERGWCQKPYIFTKLIHFVAHSLLFYLRTPVAPRLRPYLLSVEGDACRFIDMPLSYMVSPNPPCQ